MGLFRKRREAKSRKWREKRRVWWRDEHQSRRHDGESYVWSPLAMWDQANGKPRTYQIPPGDRPEGALVIKTFSYPPGWDKPMTDWATALQVAALNGHGHFTLEVRVEMERVDVPLVGSHRIAYVPGREIYVIEVRGGLPWHPRRRIWHPLTERDAQRLVEILAQALPDIWDIETPRLLPGWMLVRLAGEVKRWKGYATR